MKISLIAIFVLLGKLIASGQMLQIDGTVRDKLTQLPISNIKVEFCPNTGFGNATVFIRQRITVATTDECGFFSGQIEKSLAKYSSHGSSYTGAVLLFTSYGEYGEFYKIIALDKTANIVIERARPLFDTLRLILNSKRDALTFEFITNTALVTRGYGSSSGNMHYSIRASETVAIWQLGGLPSTKIFEKTGVKPGDLVSHTVIGLQPDKEYNYLINVTGDFSDSMNPNIRIKPSEELSDTIRIFPKETTSCIVVEKIVQEPELYPNPSTSGSAIKLELPSDLRSERISVILYDCLGVMTLNVEGVVNSTLSIDNRNLKPGVYHLMVKGTKRQYNTKLIIH